MICPLALLAVFLLQVVPQVNGALNLTIIHANDVHSHFESFNGLGGRCTESDLKALKCYGGAARRQTVIKRLREKYPDALVLNAGDEFQGSAYYTLLKWIPVAAMLNEVHYDMMTFGNHEFDDGIKGLTPFVRNLSFPVVNTNIDPDESTLNGTFHKHLILKVTDQQIAILGYTTLDAPTLADTGPLKFHDEVESLTKEIELLKSQGIRHFIGVGHSGLLKDRELCQKVPGLDIIIGGHSHSLLYTGDVPSNDISEGPYPEVYDNPDGGKCLVTQVGSLGKYLGLLQVTFNDKGEVESWGGNPILINNSYPEDEGMLKVLEKFTVEMEQFKTEAVGYFATGVDGARASCRLKECNLGNIYLDAMVYAYLAREKNLTVDTWSRTPVAIHNGGGIRDFGSKPHYNMTLEDVYSVLPFTNTLKMVQLNGSALKSVFEHSVYNYDPTDQKGKFLQVSGIQVIYDLSKPNGQRVASLKLKCQECPIPQYEPLKMEKVYNVILTDYMARGGDGYQVIADNLLFDDKAGLEEAGVFMEYIKKFQPITTGVEGRIQFFNEEGIPQQTPSKFYASSLATQSPVEGATTKFSLSNQINLTSSISSNQNSSSVLTTVTTPLPTELLQKNATIEEPVTIKNPYGALD